MKMKKVLVWISDDERSLIYKTVKKGRLDIFKTRRKIPIKNIQNFLYGGLSGTFKKHQKLNLRVMQLQRPNAKMTMSERKIERKYSLRLRNQRDQHKSRNAPDVNISETLDWEPLFPWECLSLFRSNFTTLDLVIPDHNYLLALMHVLHREVYRPPNVSFMRIYK